MKHRRKGTVVINNANAADIPSTSAIGRFKAAVSITRVSSRTQIAVDPKMYRSSVSMVKRSIKPVAWLCLLKRFSSPSRKALALAYGVLRLTARIG